MVGKFTDRVSAKTSRSAASKVTAVRYVLHEAVRSVIDRLVSGFRCRCTAGSLAVFFGR